MDAESFEWVRKAVARVVERHALGDGKEITVDLIALACEAYGWGHQDAVSQAAKIAPRLHVEPQNP